MRGRRQEWRRLVTWTTYTPNSDHQAGGTGEAVEWGEGFACGCQHCSSLLCWHTPCPLWLAGLPIMIRPFQPWPSVQLDHWATQYLWMMPSRYLWAYQVCSSYQKHTAAPALLAQSLCNDSPSLARLVDLHQSKRERPAELGLRCSYWKIGARPGLFQTTVFLPLVYALGPCLWSWITY